MYTCLDCLKKFEKPLKEREVHYECDEHPFETLSICPYCRGLRIEEADYE